MRGPGTDEETLIELLCTRTNDEIDELKRVYSEVHNRDLERDIISETSGNFECLLVAILQGQRDESEEVDQSAAQEQAQELYDAGEARWGTNETVFTHTLARRSWAQLRLVLLQLIFITFGKEKLWLLTTKLLGIRLKKRLSPSVHST